MKTTLPSEIAVEVFNRPLGVTPEQVEAMLAGSLFGWNCPAANPKSRNKKTP